MHLGKSGTASRSLVPNPPASIIASLIKVKGQKLKVKKRYPLPATILSHPKISDSPIAGRALNFEVILFDQLTNDMPYHYMTFLYSWSVSRRNIN